MPRHVQKCDTYGMMKCPICKRLFLYNPQSIYKIHKSDKNEKSKIIYLCRYTCYRKAGGGLDKKATKVYSNKGDWM